MHVVMLAAHREVFQALHNGAGAAADVHGVINAVAAGVADPLAAGDELPFRILAEGVAHTAVAARQANAGAHRLADVHHVLVLDLAHGPAGHNEVQAHQHIKIGQHVQRVADGAFVVVFFQQTGETLGGELGLVAVPAALEDQCFFHGNCSFQMCDRSYGNIT